MGPQYLKWEPGNRPRHLRPPCHLTPLVPTQSGKMRRGWHELPGRSSGPTVSYQYESSVTTFGEGSWQCFFFTDPRVPGLLCKKSIPWLVPLVLLPECFHSPRPQGPGLLQARHFSQGPLHRPPSRPVPHSPHVAARGIFSRSKLDRLVSLKIISAQETHANR